MITRLSVLLCLLLGLALSHAIAGEREVMHGIRNRKCAADEEAAKMQIFDELRDGKGFCSHGAIPAQVDGWTCRKGGDCPKTLYRCNTQYRCGDLPQAMPAQKVETAPVMPVIQKPAPMAAPVPAPVPAAQPLPKR